MNSGPASESRVDERVRESGFKRLAKVPGHWGVARLKFVTSTNDDALSDREDPLRPVAYVDISSVDSTRGITQVDEMVFEDSPSRARRLVRDGDTIVSTVRTYLRAIAPITDPSPTMVVSTGFAVIRPRALDPGFSAWVLRGHGFVEEVVARSVGVSYPAINAPELGNIPIAVPPLDEQRDIAAFLDRETERIDSLIAKKRLLIERLQEYRTALITRTVTRGLLPEIARDTGLDPSPRLKPSGVEWLGDVPEHWEVGQLKRWFRVVNGGTPKSSEDAFWDGDIVWLTPDDLGRNVEEWIGEGSRKLTLEGLESCSARLCPEGSVVVSTRAPIGHVAITSITSATNQGCRTLVPGTGVDSEFAYFTVIAMKKILESLGQGSTLMELSQGDLGSVRLAKPPLDEQRALVRLLNRETARLANLTSRTDAAIRHLQEYRAALITAAVTGKIDVRDGASSGRGSAESRP